MKLLLIILTKSALLLILYGPIPPWSHWSHRVGSCGWQEAEIVEVTKGCQKSVSQSKSTSAHANHLLFSDIGEDQPWRPTVREAEDRTDFPHSPSALDAQIRWQQREDFVESTVESGWGYCYSRAHLSSTSPPVPADARITFTPSPAPSLEVVSKATAVLL